MAVAKRQGRSEDQSEDFRQNKQHSWLSPICIGQTQVKEKHIKGGAKALSCSLSLPHACALSLSLAHSLSLSPHSPPHSSLRVFGLACPQASRMDSPAIF